MGSFDYICAESVEEAVSHLADGEGKVLAGGTNLVPLLRRGPLQSRRLVDINRIRAIRILGEDAGRITVGAGVTFAQLAISPLVQSRGQPLSEAALQVGSSQIRNVATLGGHIASGFPAADGVVALLALGATLQIRSSRGTSRMGLSRFLETKPGHVALEADELIVAVEFSEPPPATRSMFLKLGHRKAFSFSRVSLCMLLALSPSGSIEQAAIAVGAAGPYPFRLASAEGLLVGPHPTPQLVDEAIEVIGRDVAHKLGKDFSAAYKRQAICGLAREALDHCLDVGE